MTSSDLYDDDILLWSEQQAELLRRRAAGELVNDAELDWPNIAEEIGDVGRSERNAVESHLVLARLHDLKAEAWPLSRDVPHWRAEAVGHRDDARRRFSPSMAQRIDVAKLYREALRRMPETIDAVAPPPVPAVCPVTLAIATSRIKIGFAVLQTSLYHPLRMAEQISLIDNLSKGRLIVGLGRGSLVNTHEYSGYQIDPDTAQERFEEVEKILLQCWTQEKVVHSGKYWNFEIPMLRPRPYTKPYPQVLRSVASEASLAAQARLGRPVLMAAATAPGAARSIEIYRTAAREAGVSANQIDDAIAQSWVARTVVLAPTDQEAVEVGLPYYEQMQTYRAAQSTAFEEMVAKTRASGRLPVLCGSPDSMLEDFTSLAATGVGGVFVRFRTGPMPAEFSSRALKLFMEEIAPRIRGESFALA